MDEEPIKVIKPPTVILVKEYKIDSADQDTSSRPTNSEPQDERILVSPSTLADDVSVISYPTSISTLDNAPIAIHLYSLISKNVIKYNVLNLLGAIRNHEVRWISVRA